MSKEKKRFLYSYTDRIKSQDIPWTLLELGYDVHIYMDEVHIQEFVNEEKQAFIKYLEKAPFDYVITFDFSTTIAQACYEIGVKYIVWSYDSPLKELYSTYAKYATNYIFVMDKRQQERLADKGLEHLYYMPLATNMTRVNGLVITEEDEKKYKCNISMVGSLYNKGFMDKMIHDGELSISEEIQQFVYQPIGKWTNGDSIYGRISQEAIRYMQIKNNNLDAMKEYGMDNQFFYESMLTRDITFYERVIALTELSEEHEVFLYTGDSIPFPENVHVMPKIDYQTETPKVFHLSKINLNITLRSIESGVSQRIYDIMSVGGFVLSNYQKELEELFVPDKEIVLFHTIDELKDKVNYYLTHEEERIRIAIAGYQKVKECYSYTKILRDMIKIVDEN